MTAFIDPALGSFDNQLPFGNTQAQQLQDQDINGVPSSAILTDDFDSSDGLSLWNFYPHQHLPSAHLDHTPHSAVPRTPYLFANNSSNASASAPSTTSSVKGSPLAHSVMTNAPHPTVMSMPADSSSQLAFDSTFGMSMPDGSLPDFMAAGSDDRLSGFVDPSLLQPSSGPTSQATVSFSVQPPPASIRPNSLTQHNSADSTLSGSHQFKKSRSNSPFLTSSQSAWQPYPQTADARRISSHSFGGPNGNGSTRSSSSDAEDREKGRCPFADCGKVFKDLKAHMLTHQNERPEKCPIPSCEYNKKGFSRKYDKNRHTLTHYKGTMICGFCPGSGSAAEKSFNRADVFKRHLTTVHNVEQAPLNSKKKHASAGTKDMHKAPGSTGKCSICSNIFQTPQDFYEHLEECVLDVVQKVDPGEAINEAILASMADDKDTNDTIKRHAIVDPHGARDADAESDDDGEDQDEKAKPQNWQLMQSRRLGSAHHAGDVTPTSSTAPSSTGPSGLPSSDHNSHSRGPGITYSASGIPFHKQPRKRRKNYPNSWGCSADKMKMKKRVLTVFDGCNRLVKDDMMISSDFEVRMNLNLPAQPGQSSNGQLVDSGAYVTDLDVETLRRAEGFFQATEEEKGPWKWTNVPGSAAPQGIEIDLDGLMA